MENLAVNSITSTIFWKHGSFSIYEIYKTATDKVSKKMQKFSMQRLVFVLFFLSHLICKANAVVSEKPTFIGLVASEVNNGNTVYNSTSSNRNNMKSFVNDGIAGSGVSTAVAASGYLDKLDNLERSVAAVLIKVAYGTTSTTKRSIPDNSFVPSLTTVATPLLTTLRYMEKSPHQQTHINFQNRNYELDLERDHALPTSAPNADILKSNSNPTYPNPNRPHSHDRERHRHLYNSTPMPSLPNLLKKGNSQLPTVPMYPGDIPSYSPPSRSFFTPPLPPEYQNPFADKPTLRGTNNDGIIANTGTYINRRPIPPPSLMPGHERIPFRPPDLNGTPSQLPGGNGSTAQTNPITTSSSTYIDIERKKALNIPSHVEGNNSEQSNKIYHDSDTFSNQQISAGGRVVPTKNDEIIMSKKQQRQEVLPSIRRILSGSNGKKSEIPEELLRQVTTSPIGRFHSPPSSAVVIIDSTAVQQGENYNDEYTPSMANINKVKNKQHILIDHENKDNKKYNIQAKSSSTSKEQLHDVSEKTHLIAMSSTPSEAATTAVVTMSSESISSPDIKSQPTASSSSTSSTVTDSAAAAIHTWTIAWNIHVYLSVILFTILVVYSFYKILTYNKLTHLFSQSYFVCIHLILIFICSSRIFYLCYDAYNIHGSFHIFIAEMLLNLPATFLTISFSVLILYLFLKSFNHKNNRYSALIRPLTVVVGCGVHVVLCITLHYVESYTMQNQQQHFYFQQQQQLNRRQQQHSSVNLLSATLSPGTVLYHQQLNGASANLQTTPPPRVLSLICQIIYIFICLSLGLLYLYLYRILKRILRSKSQNYIHGYQNLSYGIHITIATALLFVLLAALQIFGAISISTTRTIVTQGTAEIDWLQWGYQFSLRLIEIAIITLISWVASLKTSGNVSSSAISGDIRLGSGGTVGTGSSVYGAGGGSNVVEREKHSLEHHRSNQHHTNVANFFLPCTSSSSQEHFDTDYPAVCNANTNLHTYTMRTGKLIYDSYALNSLGSDGQHMHQIGNQLTVGRNCAEYQLQQPTYQRPYDTGSLQSSFNRIGADYGNQHSNIPNHRRYHHTHDQEKNHYTDYLTDGNTDHYENPNFDLHGCSSSAGSTGFAVTNNTIQKFAKTFTGSTTASNSSGAAGSSAASHQQMMLLQNDNCYSEPLDENYSYDFNNFERPKFGKAIVGNGNMRQNSEMWQDQHMLKSLTDKELDHTLERDTYENSDRRSSISMNSNGGCAKFASHNSFDRTGYSNGIRKSGTLNNVGSSVVINESNMTTVDNQRSPGVQTLAMTERELHHPRSSRGLARPSNSSVEHKSNHTLHQQQHHQNSDCDDDDDIISGSNVECTNLINNENGSCITNSSSSTNSAGGNLTDQGICSNSTNSGRLQINLKNNNSQQQLLTATKHSHSPNVQSNPIAIHLHHNTSHTSSGHETASGASSNSGTNSTVSESMLVADQGFLRFRALDDINNAQGVGIHNATVRNQSRVVATISSNASGSVVNSVKC